MTSTKPPTRPSRHGLGNRGHASPSQNGRSAVGERLRDARETRGVDLFRVERDTKIRAKYLGALEDGEFADLPGDVYARGFLRNYATYLGLDPDELEEEWREEAGQAVPIRSTIVGPQPLTMRRKVVLERSHMVMAMVAVIVLIVAGYFGFQLTRYLSYPTLSVSSAGPSQVIVGIGDTEYVLTGTATANTPVLISWNGQDPKTVTADETGHWTFHAILQAGPNQFDITAKNLDTNHASSTVRLTVVVPVATPTPQVPSVTFVAPADGATVPAGTVTITGTSTLVSSVNLTTAMVGPPLFAGATMPPTPTAGTTPAPGLPTTSTAASADGTFQFAVPLQPGLWRLTIVGVTTTGAKTTAVTKTISIPYKTLTVSIRVVGGTSAVTIYQDGLLTLRSVNHPNGWSKTVSANRSVCLLAGKPSLVYLTVNGSSIGSMASVGGSLRHVLIDAKGARGVAGC
jgi:cytoskeletal protein RodZ